MAIWSAIPGLTLKTICTLALGPILLFACETTSRGDSDSEETRENIPKRENVQITGVPLLLIEDKNSATIGEMRPEPVFAVRSSTLGAIEANRPEFFQYGNPSAIEYQGWRLLRVGTEVVRKKVARTGGTREFDRVGRVISIGRWSDGTIIVSKFEYDSDGKVLRNTLIRNEQQLGCVEYRYESSTDFVRIWSVAQTNGAVVETEIQTFDKARRLAEDRVQDSHSAVVYSYEYDESGNISSIGRFKPGLVLQFVPGGAPLERLLFGYDHRGRVSNFERLTSSSKGLIGTPISYEYDDNGMIVRETYGEGKDAQVVEYTYEFDDHGNWIRQTGWPVTDNPDATGYEIVRTITYYE